MLSLIKLLKIALPVTTVTAATIATVSLVSFKKEDSKLGREKEDTILQNFEKPIEEFKEQTMLYSENGQGENVTVTEEVKKQLENKTPEKNQNKGSEIADNNSSHETPKKSLELLEDQTPEEKGTSNIPTSLNKENAEVSSASLNSISEPEPSDIDSSNSRISSEKDITQQTLGGEEEKSKAAENKGFSSSDEEAKDENIRKEEEGSALNTQTDDSREQDNTQTLDQNESGKDVASENGGSGEPKTTLDGVGDSSNINGGVDENGIKGEYGINEISEEQIKNMIQLEEDALSVLNSLKRLVN